MSKIKKKKATDIITPPIRIAFPHLFVPRAMENEDGTPGKPKYECAVLIPPDVSLKPFKRAIDAAMKEKWGKVVKLKGDNYPLHDADEKEDLDGYDEGWHFLNAKSGYRPDMIDAQKEPIIEPGVIYAGCWCHLLLRAYTWVNKRGGKGVSFSLEAVMFRKKGDRLDGRKSALDAFEDLECEDEDELFDDDVDADDDDDEDERPAKKRKKARRVVYEDDDDEDEDAEDMFR